MKKIVIFLLFMFVINLNFGFSGIKNSIMDPHYPYKNGPWFEGWYTRITDDINEKSFAIIAGVYFKSSTRYVPGDSFYGYMAILVSDEKNSAPKVFAVFPDDIKLKTHGKDLVNVSNMGKITDFEFISKYGVITQDRIDVNIPGKIKFNATIKNRMPWKENSEEGPTGLLSYLKFFPLHWYVYNTIGSSKYQVEYSPASKEGWVEYDGAGYVHQEKNWGTSFPLSWVWGQGSSLDKKYFVLSGGENKLGPLNTEFWILGYRSKNMNIDFSLKKKSDFETVIDSCSGKFKLEGKWRNYRFILNGEALPSTFSQVATPSISGFAVNGGEESFSATYKIEIFKNEELVETAIYYNAALEFGAAYMCQR